MHALFERIQMTAEDFKAPPFTRLSMLLKLKNAGMLTDDLYWRTPSELA